MRQLIQSGEFYPGHKLLPKVEMTRSRRHSVSRISLSEALNALIGSNQSFYPGIVRAAKNSILEDFMEKVRDLRKGER